MFAFYDFETTGTSPKFDQPLQFAAILTDDNLVPVEEVDIRCRLSQHILPSPIAMAITGVTPDLLTSPILSWYEFSRELADLIDRWSPATWVGYNSLSFDENVFRQLFYQNLDPTIYRTQFNGNNRLDILKLVYACWAFGIKELKIPTAENGKQTSRLDHLAPLNGFSEHDAHDALGDVRATIFITKLIRDQVPEIWQQVIANLDRDALRQQLEAGQIFHLVERFGVPPPRVYTGVYCGVNAEIQNRIGYFDLVAGDTTEFTNADPELVEKAVSESPKIIRSVDLGAMPLLFPASQIAPEHLDQAAQITQNKVLHDLAGKALAARFADRETPELVEAQIYEGFYNHADKKLLEAFHQAEWQERAKLVQQLTDVRLKELGNRMLVLNAPELVPDDVRQAFWSMVSERWKGKQFYGESERNPGNTYQSVQDDLEEVKTSGRFDLPQEQLSAMIEFFTNRKVS